ncbi:MAG: sugar kinase [Candidatus Coatesbacteria bacterium]|nr:sugar kinase [Candidatus Coatesbacteria bacterium]
MDIISIGECMVEMFCDGRIKDASLFTKAYGGDTLNTIVAASRLGSRTGFITKVGIDPFSDFLTSSWRSEGIDLSHSQLVPGFNSIYFISLTQNGAREFTYYRPGSAASTLSPDDLDADYIGSAKVVHTSGITQAISRTARDAALAAFKMARSAGVLTSFDPNLRLKLTSLEQAKKDLMEILEYTDIFLPSSPDETGPLFPGMTEGEIAEFVMGMGVRFVAIKQGERGCLIASSDGVMQLRPELDVTVVDTTGAGDAFNGAFIHGIAHGLSAREAARLGLTMASLKIRGRGAILSLPTKEELVAALPNDTIRL